MVAKLLGSLLLVLSYSLVAKPIGAGDLAKAIADSEKKSGSKTTEKSASEGKKSAEATKLEEEKKAPTVKLENDSVLSLQTNSEVKRINFKAGGGAIGYAELYNLNQTVNVWYALKIFWPHKKDEEWFHLENLYPKQNRIELDSDYFTGVVIASGDQKSKCNLWSQDGAEIKLAKFNKKPFSELCEGQVYLRNRIEGYRTTKEWVVEFLRDNIWGGEALTEMVKNTIYKDAYLEDSKLTEKNKGHGLSAVLTDRPKPALLGESQAGAKAEKGPLAITFAKNPKDGMEVGSWYKSKHQKDAFVSVIKPNAVAPSILASHSDKVKKLESVEAKANTYLMAFDLGAYDLHYALGTEHPRVEWSARVRPEDRDAKRKGPDGFDTIDPLLGTGLIPPHLAEKVAATFTAGFKRSHGAFKWGKLAKTNFGSHYGFIDNGVVLSKLQPGLATLVVDVDGQVSMKTWQPEDDENLGRIRYARQNGVPIIDTDPETGEPKPGDFVSNWTMGNWSGSQDRAFRSLRAGICLSQQGERQYLIYGYFSSVTPTAMARVFQAYGCQYAMHLDMNALEHTYLAIYKKGDKGGAAPEQLIDGMKVLDERFKGNVPRFIGYPDNRDFFFLVRKEAH